MGTPDQIEIRFRHHDSVLLWCIPQSGERLQWVVWYYTFVNRTAPPSHTESEGFLARSLTAGAVTLIGERIIITDLWYRRVHDADDTTANEIDSILECGEWLYARTWGWEVEGGFVLSRAAYEVAVRPLR